MIVLLSYIDTGLLVELVEQAKMRRVLLVSVKCGWLVTVSVWYRASCCNTLFFHTHAFMITFMTLLWHLHLTIFPL